jgi:hypothetical protein
MTMRIQDALTNCCEGIKEFVSAGAAWFGKSVTAAAEFTVQGAHKVAEFSKPHLEHAKTFAQENKESIIIAAVGFAVGALLTAIIANFFCGGQTPPATSTTSGTTSSSTTSATV